MQKVTNISLASKPWFYFTVDLDFPGHGVVNLIRYIDVNGDRTAALVEIEESKCFGLSHLILLPYESGVGPEYFELKDNDKFLSVWSFDGTNIGDTNSIDLKSEWPKNILDKAAITPFKAVVNEFGKNNNEI
ncbi:MAG: hypothetical protein AMS22_17275 [Thiotrichales bacterium SG8_50]|nr:MAG: hypothetical protein AMS22_17275 [Thiotrichales bacterium SG8_50]